MRGSDLLVRSVFVVQAGLLLTSFTEPVPGKEMPEQAQSPVFSHPGGFYSGSLFITLSSPTPRATIYYTTDGSDPIGSSADNYLQPYDHSPVVLNSTTVVRARSFKQGYLPSPITTRTFFIDEGTALPVISLATDPQNLWDKKRGIYVNFAEDWGKPVHLEFYESTDGRGFYLT